MKIIGFKHFFFSNMHTKTIIGYYNNVMCTMKIFDYDQKELYLTRTCGNYI